MIYNFLNVPNSLYQFSLSCQAACTTTFVAASAQAARIAVYVTTPGGLALSVTALALATLAYMAYKYYAQRGQYVTASQKRDLGAVSIDGLPDNDSTEAAPLAQPTALENLPLGSDSVGLDDLDDDDLRSAELIPSVDKEMGSIIREDAQPIVHTFGRRTVTVLRSSASRSLEGESFRVAVADPFTDGQLIFDRDAQEINATDSLLQVAIDEPIARLKLRPADPSRKSWQVAQAIIGGLTTGLFTAWNYARNYNRSLPAYNIERPNLLAAITRLRSEAFLGTSVFQEVAIELESKYPHLKIAQEGAKTELDLTLPDLEEGKTLLAIPTVLEGQINHMVTFVIDTENNQIEYFDPKGRSILDSQGTRLNKQNRPEIFDVYLAILKKYGSDTTRVLENTLPHQSDINNCGTYVLRYITNRARRLSAEALQNAYTRESIWTFRDQLDEMLCSVAPATMSAPSDFGDDFDFPQDLDN